MREPTFMEKNGQDAIEAYTDAMNALSGKPSSFDERQAREAIAYWEARAREEGLMFVQNTEDKSYSLVPRPLSPEQTEIEEED